MAHKFKSRYPLLLPRQDDMTPRWLKTLEHVKQYPNLFLVRDLGGGFSQIHRKHDKALDTKVHKMLEAMHVSVGAAHILDVDPIQTVSPTLLSLWTGRGYKVCAMGIITLDFGDDAKYYQYPFVEVADGAS